MTLSELIEKLGGTLLQGNQDAHIEGVNSASQAGPVDLVFAEDEESAAEALTGNAAAVVLRPNTPINNPFEKGIVEAPNPRLWFARAAKLLNPAPAATSIHPSAVVDPSAQLGRNAIIEAGAIIGAGVKIGNDCRNRCSFPCQRRLRWKRSKRRFVLSTELRDRRRMPWANTRLICWDRRN